MVLGHHELVKRIDELFPKEKPYKIGAASVDVRVGDQMMREDRTTYHTGATEYNPWVVGPGEFILASMFEHTVVPRGLACLFLLKSTLARMGWSHSFAGWIDPGWEGTLTMELKNYNRDTPLALWPGMPIGQLIYMETIGDGHCYGGRYQNSIGVVSAREEIEYDAGK